MKQTSLQGIANKAAQDKTYRFRNLFGMLTAGFLFLCWEGINRKASAGVDRIDAIAYEENLIGNIQELAAQVKQGIYRAKLILRKYIPKLGGKTRPLGLIRHFIQVKAQNMSKYRHITENLSRIQGKPTFL
jgi:hypothetical protein